MRGDRAGSRWPVAERIGMPDGAVIGHEIDQQERSLPDDRSASSECEVQWNEHAARGPGTELDRSRAGVGGVNRFHRIACHDEKLLTGCCTITEPPDMRTHRVL